MRVDVENLMKMAGDKHTYQKIIVLLVTFSWMYFNLMSISLPYLERTSTVRVSDPASGEKIAVQLNYTLCEETDVFEYEERRGHSWVIKYDVECDKLTTGFIGTSTFSGVLVGSLMLQYMANNFGRKMTVIIGGFGYSTILLCYNFAQNVYILFVLNFLLQIFAFFGILGSYLFCMENSSPERRSIYGAIINSGFAFGGFLFILGYKYLDSWKWVFNSNSGFCFVSTLIFLMFAVETPRFYFMKRRLEKMYKSLNYISKVNNREHLEANEDLIQNDDDNSDAPKKSNYNVFTLLKYKSQRRVFLTMCYIWLSTTGMYYGLNIYLKNLPGDIYFNGIYIYSLELIGYFLSSWMIDIPSLGRKKTMLIYQGMTVLGCFSIIFFQNNGYLQTVLAFIVWFGLSGIFNINFTYSNECYPTVVRAVGFGMNSVCARVSNILFPLLLELMQEKIMILFAGLSIVAFLAMTLLPETFGKPLRNDIPELEKLNESINPPSAI